jgi:hypothetical protein
MTRVKVPGRVAKRMKRRRKAKAFFKGFGKGIWDGINLPGMDKILGMAGPEGEAAAAGLDAIKAIGKPIAELAKSRKPLRLARQAKREDRREQRMSRRYWRRHPKEARAQGVNMKAIKQRF